MAKKLTPDEWRSVWAGFRAREIVVVALVDAGYLPGDVLFEDDYVHFMMADSDMRVMPPGLRDVLKVDLTRPCSLQLVRGDR